MSDAVCPFAFHVPGPASKRGYSGQNIIYPKVGVVIHTAQYDLPDDEKVLYNVLIQPGREASWHYTISREGFCYEHYPPLTTTWHCGNMYGNLRHIGIECEGFTPDPIDGPQYDVLVRLLRWLGEAAPWEWYVDMLREHAEFSATLCKVFSDGMLDKGQLLRDLSFKEEEPMPDTVTKAQLDAAVAKLERDFGLHITDRNARLSVAGGLHRCIEAALKGDWPAFYRLTEGVEDEAREKWHKEPE